MYLYIRTWALIDTGKYLTTIYMVYLYLCSSDAVMQWATLALLLISCLCFDGTAFLLVSLSVTDDHKHFMSFHDALSSFNLWCWTDLVGEKWRSKTCHVLLWFWNIPVVFFSVVVVWFCFFILFLTFLTLWNMLHTDSRGYDNQSVGCFLAFQM